MTSLTSAQLDLLIASACRSAEELGVSVFPVRVEPDPSDPNKSTKRPLIKGWQNGAAVSNPAAIEELFRQHASAVTHAGIQTGSIIVLDLDGEQAQEWWRKHLAMLPPTRTVDTRRPGGKHLFYRVPANVELRNSAGRIAPGVDFRGVGGFVVDWSAEHPPAVDEVADAPAALIEFLQRASSSREQPNGTSDGGTAGDGFIGEGQRNAFLSKEAYRLRRLGFTVEQIYPVLLAFNAACCRPPLGAAEVRAVSAGKANIEAEGETAWPAPVDILAEFGAPELRPECLPAVLSEYPAAFAAGSGHDPTITLSAALAAAAASLSDQFQIVADSSTGWFQPPILWTLAIGRPGAGKTPGQRAMLAPLWKIHRELDEQWHQEVAGLDKDAKKPPKPRIIIADATIEALSEALRDNPRGLLLANDEFESWLGSLDAYRRSGVSRDRGEWLGLFDGGPHTVERVTRGSVLVPNWGCSILTATTPSALAKLTRELPEDGLLQRFLPFVARAVTDQRAIPELEALREHYAELLARLYAATPKARKGKVGLSFHARDFFRDWLKQTRLTAEAFGSVESALEAHLAKYPSFLLRIALVLHAAKIVSQDVPIARDPGAFEVTLETIQEAAAFLQAARRHAIAVYVNRSGSETYQLAREVARTIIARQPEVIARRDLIQTVRSFRAAEGDRQDAVLRLLVDLGWLRPVEDGYQKAVAARYAVNPAVATKYAALANRERQRRTAIREAIAETVENRRAERADQ